MVNIGSGKDISIKELVECIVGEVGYKGQIIFDKTKPDGTPRKLMDTSKINKLGWTPLIELDKGIKKTINEFLLSID